MKFLGYVLLVGGFLWLLEDALIGFPKEQSYAWYASGGLDIYSGRLPSSVSTQTVGIVVSQFQQRMSKRYRLILLPACLMLAGGIALGAQRRGAGKGASTAEPERKPTAELESKPRADERRWDNPAAW